MKLSSIINISMLLLCTTTSFGMEEKKFKATLGSLGTQGAIKYEEFVKQNRPSANLEVYLGLSHDLLPALPISIFHPINNDPEKINLLKEEVEKSKITTLHEKK